MTPTFEHTPEPWGVDDVDGQTIETANGIIIADAFKPVDALRIISSINACKGISNINLNSSILQNLTGGTQKLLDSNLPSERLAAENYLYELLQMIKKG